MNKIRLIVLVSCAVAAIGMLSGCAGSASSQSFPRSMARTGFDVAYGQVLSTRIVEIEGEATGLGQFGGAWLGTAIGLGNSSYFSGARRVLGAVGGIAGAIAGEAIERAAKTGEGLQIVVQLDRNETVAVVQALDIPFEPGDRVLVLRGGDGSLRVQHL